MCPQQTAKYNPSSNLEKKIYRTLAKNISYEAKSGNMLQKVKNRSTVLHRSLVKLGSFTAQVYK